MTAVQILLVDAEARFIEMLQPILEHHGYACEKAVTGAEAIHLLKSRSFDLALLDIDLPDISGCDVAKYIADTSPQTIAIMLTGGGTVQEAVQAMKLGAYDFLHKPLNHELLLQTLEKAVEHNRLKTELQNSEYRFKVLAEGAWEGIVIHKDGKIVEANRPFRQMFGFDTEESLKGFDVARLLQPEVGGKLPTCPDERAEGVGAVMMCRPDGRELSVEAKAREIVYQEQPMQVWVLRDMTRRLQVEQEKLELQRKLAAAEKLNALGLMAGSVAHDLNNILTGVVSYPDLLLRQMDNSNPFYSQIEKIREAGMRAAAVVSDLMAITRGRNQPKSIQNPNELIKRYLESLEHTERLTHFPGAEVKTGLHPEVANLYCSPQHLHKLLLNLIGNALEAIGPEGTVKVSTDNCSFKHPLNNSLGAGGNSFVKLTVADDGPGISDEDLVQIFDPFYSTKVMGKSGTGLGLSVVWNIVQDHGGWIEVHNTNPGARFDVYLPASAESVSEVSVICGSVKSRRGERILVVDDQVEQNEIFEAALRKLGYNTHSLTSGEAAIKFLRENRVDLLMIDMLMGQGLNGRETLEVVLKEWPELKVIVVSGYARKEEFLKSRELGVNVFLEKPVTLADMDSAVRAVLDS
ncbi:response regulator [Desulfosediminicola sp.]|uniref:hybrid sensor histidine kinase/response regulator n=1 Tax=Desulfosediminicola sp. TaxID=2886825 RepID=UPI003AF2B9C0